MSGDQFEAIANRLLEAERAWSGLRPEDVELGSASNRPDRGVDAFVKMGAPGSEYLSKPTLFQFKLGFVTSKLVTEIRSSDWLRAKLADGVRYIVVTSSDLSPGAELDRARYALSSGIARATKAQPEVDVWPQVRLIEWLRRHRPLWRYVPGAPAATSSLRTFAEWEELQRPQHADWAWTSDRARDVAIAQIRTVCRSGGAIRVTGAPGVGKTRLVLEALRVAVLEPQVSFVETVPDEPLSLLHPFAVPTGGVLVIDECPDDVHVSLAANLRARDVLITIGARDDRLAYPPTGTIVVEPLDLPEVEKIALAAGRGPPDRTTRVDLARSSGGYPKLLRVLFDAVAQASSEGASIGPLNHAGVKSLLTKFLGGDVRDLQIGIQALALPTRWSVDIDMPVLAKVAEAASLQAALARLKSLALVGLLAHDRYYMTPKALGDWLATEYWTTQRPCVVLERLERSEASRELVDRCMSRLTAAGPEGAAVLKELISGCGGRLRALLSEQGFDRVMEAFATWNPAAALPVLGGLIGSPTGRWSVALARALARCAWERDLFAEAARALASATSTHEQAHLDCLSSLFGVGVGQTQAEGEARLDEIRNWARSPTPQLQMIAATCAGEACQPETGWRATVLRSVDVASAWRPSSVLEERTYCEGAAQVLSALIASLQPDVRDAAAKVGWRVARGLVRAGHTNAGATIFEALVAVREPLHQLRDLFDTVKRFDIKSGGFDETRWSDLERLLEPRSLQERVALAVERFDWSGTEQFPDVEAAAKAFLAGSSEDRDSTLRILSSRPAHGSFAFGTSVGKQPSARGILEDVINLADAPALRFAAGYLLALSGTPSGEDLLDELAASKRNARLVFEATWMGTPSPRGATRLERLVRDGSLEPAVLAQLTWGGWLLHIDGPSVRKVLEAAQPSPAAALSLAFQVATQKKSSEFDDVLIEAWERVDPTNLSTHSHWEWEETARRFLSSNLARVRRRLLELLCKPGSATRLDDGMLQLVRDVAELAPVEFWQRWGPVLEALGEHAWGLCHRLSGRLPMPLEAVKAWVGDFPERATLAAELTGSMGDSPENLASWLLEAFPNVSDVEAVLASHVLSGHVLGHESELWKAREETLRSLMRTKRPAVARFARRLLAEVESRRTNSLQAERAYQEGVLPLPLASE